MIHTCITGVQLSRCWPTCQPITSQTVWSQVHRDGWLLGGGELTGGEGNNQETVILAQNKSFIYALLCVCVCIYEWMCVFVSSSQSTFVNRPALGILPPENFPDKLTESLLSVSNTQITSWSQLCYWSDWWVLHPASFSLPPPIRWLPVGWLVSRPWPVAPAPMRMPTKPCSSGTGWVTEVPVTCCEWLREGKQQQHRMAEIFKHMKTTFTQQAQVAWIWFFLFWIWLLSKWLFTLFSKCDLYPTAVWTVSGPGVHRSESTKKSMTNMEPRDANVKHVTRLNDVLLRFWSFVSCLEPVIWFNRCFHSSDGVKCVYVWVLTVLFIF